jgi:hypothetical protein
LFACGFAGHQTSDPSRPDECDPLESPFEQVVTFEERNVFIAEKDIDAKHSHNFPA